jgi:hypothetical protein
MRSPKSIPSGLLGSGKEVRGMYSPQIREDLIPPLYRLAKARRVPMTRLVSDILAAAVSQVRVEEVQAIEERVIRQPRIHYRIVNGS